MYLNGTGVEESASEALKWYRLAAKENNPIAQGNVGWMYYHGKGVQQSYSEARWWIQLAAEQGNEDAINALNSISSKTAASLFDCGLIV
ncbi:hypothetical protein SmJEL517_g03367 [Synchytrium microbalum]|uniref:Sel1 repeat family protein n=1 Tax=Synchytrium microbalum TaxID=1806994 RepID=A0A507C499_9FUNG|nr:uncharacterized protein SmJEL517_g03367 [Synchytrium microbalum]TPX33919.1 hypothetical protein SmJEL517_g03367 [Synchytrium microbalum]